MLRSAILIAAVATLLSGCVLGADQSPGCRVGHPQDCESGWSCRDGVCMRPTTTLTPPDASLTGDAPDSSQPEAASDAADASEAEAHSDASDEPEAEAHSDASDEPEADAHSDASDEPEAEAQQDAVSEFDTGEEPGDDVGSEASGDAAGDAMLD